jgi:hypothetical protein
MIPVNVTLLEQAKKLAKELRVFAALVRDAPGDEVDPDITATLQAPLCILTQMLIQNAHQKIYEIVLADRRKDLTVQPQQHGPDLKNADGACFETKTSVCTVRSPTCNFNWPVPKGETEEERRRKLLDNVRAKVKGGGAILTINDGKQRLIKEYTFSESFLLEYFSRIKLGSSGNHNMSCRRCKKCAGFHRLDWLEKLSKDFELEDNRVLVDWNDAFDRANKCGH